jgi:hypothetical protein
MFAMVWLPANQDEDVRGYTCAKEKLARYSRLQLPLERHCCMSNSLEWSTSLGRIAFGDGHENTSKDLKQLFVLKNGARIHLLITCGWFVMAHEVAPGLVDFLDTVRSTLLKLHGKYRLHIALDRDVNVTKISEILRRFIEQLACEAKRTP